jgi:excisionase family DNA binding protein
MKSENAGNMESGLWDPNDVAAHLKVSRSWVYKAADNGTLPVVRIGALLRFEPAAIRAFVERMRSGKVVPLRRGP